MARVVTPWGLDLGDIPGGQLLDYYRAEGYAIDPPAETEQLPAGESAQDDVQVHESAGTGETMTAVDAPKNPDGTFGPASIDVTKNKPPKL